MEGRTPIPAPATPPGGAFSSLAHSCPVEPKYVHPYIYIVFLFPFLRRGLRFYSILSFLFFRLYVWSCGFFLSFFWVFGSLLSWVFASLGEWRMPLPQCSRPALKSRELGFSLSVWQHITFVSPVLGAVGNSGFSRGCHPFHPPSSTTYTLPYNVRSTL